MQAYINDNIIICSVIVVKKGVKKIRNLHLTIFFVCFLSLMKAFPAVQLQAEFSVDYEAEASAALSQISLEFHFPLKYCSESLKDFRLTIKPNH